jgi:hypothetical protein
MTQLGTYRKKTSDIFSALLVLFAMLLAGGQGPLAGQAPVLSIGAQSTPVDAGTGGHRSAPAIAKQQIFVSESRDIAASGWDDGHPKTFLAALGFDLAPHVSGATATLPGAAVTLLAAASPFDARAPPAFS